MILLSALLSEEALLLCRYILSCLLSFLITLLREKHLVVEMMIVLQLYYLYCYMNNQ